MNRKEAKAEIRKHLDCRKYLERAKRGGYVCPFCGSGSGPHGTGAVKYYPETNTCACHACPEPGQQARAFDVFDLIEAKYHCDFNSALLLAAEDANITIDDAQAAPGAQDRPQTVAAGKMPTTGTTAAGNAAERATGPTIDNTEYYKECQARIEEPAAASYLSARGISTATAAACGIGYDPAADPAGSGYKTPRIIIPTTAAHYIGRSIDPATEPAYMKLNNKGAKPGIFNLPALYDGRKVVFVTEGAFDALAILETGAGAVALNSTSNAALLIEKVKERRPTGKIILCLDSDPAGEKAAAEISAGLDALGVDYMTADINGGHKDPNEHLTADRAGFVAAVKAAADRAEMGYLASFLEKIQTESYKPYQTGLQFFDRLLNGGIIRQSMLFLIAAPGAGKTTLCQLIAEKMAENKKPVIYLNLEMSREQMLAKSISGRLARNNDARAPKMSALDVLQGYRWTPGQRAAVTAEMQKYARDVFPYLQYNPDGVSADIDDIMTFLHKAGKEAIKEGREAPAVVVDYVHLLTMHGATDAQEIIKAAVKRLKDYAVEYDTFVIGILAANRESNRGGRLTLQSGRDSSAIEYAADYQLSLNYSEFENGTASADDPQDVARLQQAENRNMILRVLKGRLIPPGKSAKIYFNAAQNLFFDENDRPEWLPAGATPFDDEPEKAKRKPAKII